MEFQKRIQPRNELLDFGNGGFASLETAISQEEKSVFEAKPTYKACVLRFGSAMNCLPTRILNSVRNAELISKFKKVLIRSSFHRNADHGKRDKSYFARGVLNMFAKILYAPGTPFGNCLNQENDV